MEVRDYCSKPQLSSAFLKNWVGAERGVDEGLEVCHADIHETQRSGSHLV